MKRIFASIMVLGLGATLSAAAQTAAAPAQPKVAVIVFEAAVSQTNEFQRDFADLRKKFEPKSSELKKLADEIDAQTKQLTAEADKLSESEQGNRARAIEEKRKQAQRLQEDTMGAYQQEVQQAFNNVAGKVGQLMTDYAAQHGYTLVLDASQQNQQETPAVLWADPTADITKAVVDAYNTKSGVPAPAAPAAK